MKANQIYDIALVLAEKTDDNNGSIDQNYKKEHEKKALTFIEQGIYKLSFLENIHLTMKSNITMEDSLPIPFYILKTILPFYVAAMLCHYDGEADKYNILIYEFETAIKNIKHKEEFIYNDLEHLEGLC